MSHEPLCAPMSNSVAGCHTALVDCTHGPGHRIPIMPSATVMEREDSYWLAAAASMRGAYCF